MEKKNSTIQTESPEIRQHQSDPKWSKWVPLDLQEYPSLIGDDPAFHLPLHQVIQERSLHPALEEVNELLRMLSKMRLQLRDSLHMMQIQALMRAEMALGNLRGKRVLEVGCQNGGLLGELRLRGASAMGMDLNPNQPEVGRGDFLQTEMVDPFDLVIATAVFEPGSSGGTRFDKLLLRLRQVTHARSVVVLENISFPIPFTPQQARDSGFDVLPQCIPSVNTAFGGRGCTLQRSHL